MNNNIEEEEKSKANPVALTVLLLILFVALAILCELTALLYQRFAPRKVNPALNEGISLPIRGNSEVDTGYGVPEIDGEPISLPAGDAASVTANSKEDEKKFHETINEFRRRGDQGNAETLLKRDAFAARRLKLLRALEKSATPGERRKLVDELKSIRRQTPSCDK